MDVYYNDHDPVSADWLEALMAAGLIPPGDVDDRPIEEVLARELQAYDQCHFFAGVGGWAYALALAGWPADAPVWTGSCPCQPFSSAGKRRGEADRRHLWPVFHRLIAEREPPVVFGEQVASTDGVLWLAGVQGDLEALGYAVGRADLCAAGVGAPHHRQRLWFVADAEGERRGPVGAEQAEPGRGQLAARRGDAQTAGGVGDADSEGRREGVASAKAARHGSAFLADGGVGAVADPGREQLRRGGHDTVAGEAGSPEGREEERQRLRADALAGDGGLSPWSDFAVVECSDDKLRRFEPGAFPLADGLPGRVAQLRGLGNAIVPEVAAEFIAAYMEARQDA